MDKKKRCILKAKYSMGAQVFLYDHPETDYPDYNRDNVRLYFAGSEKPFLRCKADDIIEVPNEINFDEVCGRMYPNTRWFQSVVKEWR